MAGKWCDAAIVDVNSWDLRQDGHCDKVMTDATVQLYPAGFCVREELRGAISWAMTSQYWPRCAGYYLPTVYYLSA